MRLLEELNSRLRGEESAAVAALAAVQRDLRAAAAMQPRPDDWVPLATVPVPLDREDAELLVEDYDACVSRRPLLRDFFAARGRRTRTPMDALARAVHRRCEKLSGGGDGRPVLAVVDWEGYDVAYLRDHVRMAELFAARGFETVVYHHRELRYEHGRLRLRGRPVDAVHREFLLEDMPQDPDSALPVLDAAVDGSIVLTTGFRAEWQAQKVTFGLLHQAVRHGLLPAAAGLVRRHVPETWLLTPELLAEEGLPLPAHTDLVLKPSIGSLSQGVRLGADLGEREFRAAVSAAAGNRDSPHVLQRLIPPATVPFPHLNAARDTLSFPATQLSIGFFVVGDEPAGAWSKVCPRSVPTVINHWNGGQWGGVRYPDVPAAGGGGPVGAEENGGRRW